MRYTKLIFVIGISLILTSIIYITPSSVKADPIVIGSATGGGLFTVSHNLSMPIADVNITIKSNKINGSPHPTFYHQVDIEGEYHLQSEIVQNATIAFAYPKAWGLDNYWATRVLECELNFSLQDKLLEYEVMTLWDLAEYYSWNDFIEVLFDGVNDYEYYDNLEFALFNASFFDKKPVQLRMSGQIKIKSIAYEFEFSYCVGTGRTWKGPVDEVVHIELATADLFHNHTFEPNENLSISENGQSSIASWSINPLQFEHNFVEVNCVQYVFDPPDIVETTSTSNIPLFTVENTFVFIAIAISLVLVMSIYFLGRKNP